MIKFKVKIFDSGKGVVDWVNDVFDKIKIIDISSTNEFGAPTHYVWYSIK